MIKPCSQEAVRGEICYRGFKGVLLQTGMRLKRFRTLMNATMNADASQNYRSLENVESRLLLRELLLETSPEKYKMHVERAVHSVAFFTAYGLRIDRLETDHSEFYAKLEKYSEFPPSVFRENVLPGQHLVDHRSLQWFRKRADEEGSKEELFFKHCLNQTRMVVDKGLSSGASAARALDKQAAYEYSETEVAITSSAPYTAGVMTTFGTFETFVLAMLLYPEVMKEAQKTIDTIVGSSRLPGFEDLDSLPYIRAIIKELGRWHPPAPLGLPHAVTEDDVYEDMFIPAGSTVIANVYAITRNEEFFPNPEEFRPERFVDNPDPFFKNYSVTFGFGRRICPGQHIANDQLFCLITRLLWAFDVIPRDEGFDPLKYRTPLQPRFGAVPSLPYKLVPRTNSVHSVVLEEGALAEKEAEAWESFSFR
ncbi:Fumitremorgin C synthase [Leucoagaricus sp. SymC.cos]|nr:Fumitremorgin C synthase [Leucoagaricus sp. SymC.cos]